MERSSCRSPLGIHPFDGAVALGQTKVHASINVREGVDGSIVMPMPSTSTEMLANGAWRIRCGRTRTHRSVVPPVPVEFVHEMLGSLPWRYTSSSVLLAETGLER